MEKADPITTIESAHEEFNFTAKNPSNQGFQPSGVISSAGKKRRFPCCKAGANISRLLVAATGDRGSFKPISS